MAGTTLRMSRDNKPTRSVGTVSSLLCDTGVYSDPSRRTMSQLAINRHGFIGRLWKWSARWSELSAIAKIIRLNDLPKSLWVRSGHVQYMCTANTDVG